MKKVVLFLILFILISGCINLNDKESNDNNLFLRKNEMISIYEIWETGSYNVVLFNDKTISFIYSGIPIYNNGTRNLSIDEIHYILSLSNISDTPNVENDYLSDFKIISDTLFYELNELINEMNVNELNRYYLGNDTYDSGGSDVSISFFNENVIVMFYDDGYHYDKDLIKLLEIRANMKNEMEEVWK